MGDHDVAYDLDITSEHGITYMPAETLQLATAHSPRQMGTSSDQADMRHGLSIEYDPVFDQAIATFPQLTFRFRIRRRNRRSDQQSSTHPAQASAFHAASHFCQTVSTTPSPATGKTCSFTSERRTDSYVIFACIRLFFWAQPHYIGIKMQNISHTRSFAAVLILYIFTMAHSYAGGQNDIIKINLNHVSNFHLSQKDMTD